MRLILGILLGGSAVETLHQIAWVLGRGRHRAVEAAYAERFRRRYAANPERTQLR
jgi:hypothetical protein